MEGLSDLQYISAVYETLYISNPYTSLFYKYNCIIFIIKIISGIIKRKKVSRGREGDRKLYI